MIFSSPDSQIQLPFHVEHAYKLSEFENNQINAQLENLSVEDFGRIFAYNQVDEESINESEILFIPPYSPEITTKEIKDSGFSEKKTKSSSTSSHSSQQFIQRKRGRKPIKNTAKIHDRNTPDNLLRKIQVHYFKFIIDFLNEVMKQLGFTETFCQISYKYKKNITNSFFKELKGLKLSDIICQNVSPKFKLHDENANIILYEKIKEHEILNNLFGQNFFTLFKSIYYKCIYKINLPKFGPITLSKDNVKMFDKLVEKNTRGFDKDYGEKLKLCAQEYYLKEE